MMSLFTRLATHPMLALPSQTSRRCTWRTRCTRRAVVRTRIVVEHEGTVREDSAHDYCALHRVASQRWEMGSISVSYIASPLPRFCSVCGADVEHGRCAALAGAMRATRRPFSCSCTICRVYGGDCSRSAAYDAAWECISEHDTGPARAGRRAWEHNSIIWRLYRRERIRERETQQTAEGSA